MKKWLVSAVFVIGLSVASCSSLERKDIRDDLCDYLGVPRDTPSLAIGAKVAKDVAARPDPVSLGMYGGGLLATLLTGYFGRKFIQKKYDTATKGGATITIGGQDLSVLQVDLLKKEIERLKGAVSEVV